MIYNGKFMALERTPATEMYLADIQTKTTNANAKPAVLKESPATAWVDGNNGLGPVVGNFCMQLAIQKAKAVGVGWVVAKGKCVEDSWRPY
jgi:LDH2 family malate/lactate/ureidoglycolate dehydrogenase